MAVGCGGLPRKIESFCAFQMFHSIAAICSFSGCNTKRRGPWSKPIAGRACTSAAGKIEGGSVVEIAGLTKNYGISPSIQPIISARREQRFSVTLRKKQNPKTDQNRASSILRDPADTHPTTIETYRPETLHEEKWQHSTTQQGQASFHKTPPTPIPLLKIQTDRETSRERNGNIPPCIRPKLQVFKPLLKSPQVGGGPVPLLRATRICE